MARTAVAEVAQGVFLLLQHLQRGFAQGGYTQNGTGILTVLAAGGVTAIGQGVLHGRVYYQHAYGRVCHGDELVGEVFAIQHQRMVLLAVGRDELIHNAAGYVHKLVLSGLADEGSLRGGYLCPAKGS